MSKSKTHNPTLIVGVGGTGKKAIQAVKRYIVENGSEGGLSSHFPYMSFLSFDSSTNLLDNEAVSSYEGIDDNDIRIKPYEVVQLKSSLKDFDINFYPELKEWFPEEMGQFLGAGIFSQGCQQNRVLGRFLFAWNYYQIVEPTLRSAIKNIKHMETLKGSKIGKNHNVYVVGSLSGGTGSGMFLDMMYAIRKIWYEEFADERTLQLHSFIPGPSFFEDFGATEYTAANHYAAMLEIDYYMNLQHLHYSPDRFRMQYPGERFGTLGKPGDEDHPAFRQKPADYIFVLDNKRISDATTIDISQCMEMVGSFIANMYGGELSSGYLDVNSNSSPELLKYTPVSNRPLSYSSLGIYSILFPRNIILERLSEYFTINLVADLLLPDISEIHAQEYIYKKVFPPIEKKTTTKLDFDRFINSANDISNQLKKLEEEFKTERDKNKIQDVDMDYSEIGNKFLKTISNLTDKKRDSITSEIATNFIKLIKKHLADFLKMEVVIEDKENSKRGDVSGAILFLIELDKILVEFSNDCKKKNSKEIELNYNTGDLKEKFENLISDKEVKLNKIKETYNEQSAFAIQKQKLRIIVEAIGHPDDRGKNIRKEIKNEIIFLESIQKKLKDLLKNLLPREYENDANTIDGLTKIFNVSQEKIPETKPEKSNGSLTLIDMDSPKNPKLGKLIWKPSDLSKFYHKVIPIKKEGEKISVDVEVLSRKRQNIMDKLLQPESLGSDFSNIRNLEIPRLKRIFFHEVKKIFLSGFANHTIEDQLLNKSEDGEIGRTNDLNEMKSLVETTDVYVQLNQSKLKIAGVNAEAKGNNTMKFIYLPNLYAKRPCADISSNSTGKKCPAQESHSIKCEKLDRCLKQIILNTTKTNGIVNIIHPEIVDEDDIQSLSEGGTQEFDWNQLHEIHILKVFHGFPLETMELLTASSKPSFDKYYKEGRPLLVARPRSNMPDEFYNLDTPFPSEKINKDLQDLYLLVILGYLKYDTVEKGYLFINKDDYEDCKKTNSPFKLDRRLELEEDIFAFICNQTKRSLINSDSRLKTGFKMLFELSNLIQYHLYQPANYKNQYEFYKRVIFLSEERNLCLSLGVKTREEMMNTSHLDELEEQFRREQEVIRRIKNHPRFKGFEDKYINDPRKEKFDTKIIFTNQITPIIL
jgi:hypothetical protein